MSVTTNGLSQTQWLESRDENEILIIQLPQLLRILIKGQVDQNKESFRIGLVNLDKRYLYYINFDFLNNEIKIIRNENNSPVEEETANPSDVIGDTFEFHMQFKEKDNKILLQSRLGANQFNDIVLEANSHKDNIFLTVGGDAFQLQTLQFIWA